MVYLAIFQIVKYLVHRLAINSRKQLPCATLPFLGILVGKLLFRGVIRYGSGRFWMSQYRLRIPTAGSSQVGNNSICAE